MFVILVVSQVASLDLFRAWPGDPRGSPGSYTVALLMFVAYMPVYRSLRKMGYITKGLRDLLGYIFQLISDQIWPPDEREKRRRTRRSRPPPEEDVEDLDELDAGSVVVATRPVTSRYGKEFATGSRGTVEKVYDKDGDALIKFEGFDRFVCQKSDFNRLSIEKKVCPRCSGKKDESWWSCRLCKGKGMLDVTKPWPNEPLVLPLGVSAYFLALIAMIAFIAPEEQVSTGWHQGWKNDPCEEYDRDIMLRPRRSFVCQAQYPRAYFSTDCNAIFGNFAPVDGSEWYTICGLPQVSPYDAPGRQTQSVGNVGAVFVVSVCGIFAFLGAFAAGGAGLGLISIGPSGKGTAAGAAGAAAGTATSGAAGASAGAAAAAAEPADKKND